MTAVDDEIMAFRFSANRFIDGVGDQVVAFACPKRRTKVCGVFWPRHVQSARTSKAYAITDLQKLWVIGVIKPIRPPADTRRKRRTAGGMVTFV